MEQRRPSARRRPVALLVGALLALTGLPLLAPPAAADEPTFPEVTVNRVTSDAGFTHPGLGASVDSLVNAREKVLAGVEPWKSYYDTMLKTKYASRTFSSANLGTAPDNPRSTVFNSQAVQGLLIDDAVRANTQAIQYWITGDAVYRENAMKIIRIWSKMDPTAYAYYPDAHIHSGTPLMRLLSAAELMRYTSANLSDSGYDSAWTDADTENLTKNLIVPMTTTFNSSNTRFMSQHSYSLIGALAGYIFTDDAPAYRRSVEWFSVNKDNPDDYANGALTKAMPVIARTDRLNSYGASFVQLNEMGRDQAHAWDSVSMLTALSRMIDVQGTKLDPKKGTVSTKANAVSPWQFGNNRLLKGAEQFFAYMMGHDVPFVDPTGRGGKLSPSYRGRFFDPTKELYNTYKYKLHLDVEKIAPNLTDMSVNQDSSTEFYWGTGAYNYWGNVSPDWQPDAWLSFPADIAQTAPLVQTDPKIQVERRSVAIDGTSTIKMDADSGFVRLQARKRGSTIAVRTLQVDNRTGATPIGLRVRTTGPVTIEVRADRTQPAFATITVPDTRGAWRYVTYDLDNSKLRGRAGGEALAYYTVVGTTGTRLDLDQVDLDGRTNLTPPNFDTVNPRIVAVVGERVSVDLSATDTGSETLRYSAGDLPSGATVNARTGVLTWRPGTGQIGATKTFVAATDGTTLTAKPVQLVVAADRTRAIRAALKGFDPTTGYLSATAAAVETAKAKATTDAKTADAATFSADLAAVVTAVGKLEPLTPRLAVDGSFDYWKRATSTSITAVNLGNLLDGDLDSFSGDLTAPAVIDVGTPFRVRADAFGLQARYNFANRSQGTNVYGSNDGRTWTLLTSRETTDTTNQRFAMEIIPVKPEVADQSFRYLKLQVDHPGVPTDPAYPGISSWAEFRIFGQRLEMSTAVNAVTIASSNPDPTLAHDGDTVSLTVTATEPLAVLQATIEGQPATVTKTDDQHWKISHTLPPQGAFGRPVKFLLDYTTSAGRRGATITDTTDGSVVQLWNSKVSTVTTDKSWAVASTGRGTLSEADNGARMFDGDITTFTDTTSSQGWVKLTPADGSSLTFSAVRVRPRSAFPSRANGTTIQGSADGGQTWTTLVTITGVTDGNQWYVFPLQATATVPLLRVNDNHNGYTNLAEVQLLHLQD